VPDRLPVDRVARGLALLALIAALAQMLFLFFYWRWDYSTGVRRQQELREIRSGIIEWTGSEFEGLCAHLGGTMLSGTALACVFNDDRPALKYDQPLRKVIFDPQE
jgi:hypothetical protein